MGWDGISIGDREKFRHMNPVRRTLPLRCVTPNRTPPPPPPVCAVRVLAGSLLHNEADLRKGYLPTYLPTYLLARPTMVRLLWTLCGASRGS